MVVVVQGDAVEVLVVVLLVAFDQSLEYHSENYSAVHPGRPLRVESLAEHEDHQTASRVDHLRH